MKPFLVAPPPPTNDAARLATAFASHLPDCARVDLDLMSFVPIVTVTVGTTVARKHISLGALTDPVGQLADWTATLPHFFRASWGRAGEQWPDCLPPMLDTREPPEVFVDVGQPPMFPARTEAGTDGAAPERCCGHEHKTNDGACATFEAGMNGRCVFCDHEDRCHPGPGST